jgi:transposase
MYRELQPLRQALSRELKASLPPPGAGIDEEQLLQSYLDRLTLYIGCDVADQTFTLYAQNAGGDEVAHRIGIPNRTQGFQQAWSWMESLREQHHLRILLLAMETTGVYYWAWWDFLTGRPNLARVLYNARTTEHMTEVLSKKVRNDLVDAYALAEQVRLGGTPETLLTEDSDLQTARFCSRFARDLAQQANRKKNQLRSTLRAYNPVLEQVFPKHQLHHPAVYALLEQYVFPKEFVQAGVETITQILVDKCRSAFGEKQAKQLVELCGQQLVRPIGQEVIHQRIRQLCEDIQTIQRRQKAFLKTGYVLIQDRRETKLLYRSIGAGLSNTLALVSEVGDVSRFPDGDHLASFLGITTSKHISGTTIFHSKHITKQGSPNGRYAIVNLAQHLCRRVPKYQKMYQRIKARKPARIGYLIAVVAVARDFTTNILYDMWRNQRPFFLEVADYRKYRREHPHSPA